MTLDKLSFRNHNNNHHHHQRATTANMPVQYKHQQQQPVPFLIRQYPDQLAHHELETHRRVVSDYCKELSINLFEKLDKAKPDISLIKQQPQLTPEYRGPLLDFLFKISKRTRVCSGVFYRSVRLFDRYCSKRIVLLEQAQLVATTCLWLACKTDGGCNHCAPSLGGRFQGPTVRARIPRLTELCQLCGPSCSYDEGMFVQMERHILDTLNWDVTEPSIYDWCFQVEDNNTQTTSFMSTREKDSILLKQFMIDVSLFQQDLISAHPAELASSINEITQLLQSKFTPSLLLQKHNNNMKKNISQSSNSAVLVSPSLNIELTEVLLLAITNSTETLINSYSEQTSSKHFIKAYIQECYHYLLSLQQTKFASSSLHNNNNTHPDTFTPESSVNGSDSGCEEDYNSSSYSDTDSLFEHIVNRSISSGGTGGSGSRTPSPLPSPNDKVLFGQMKRHNSSGTTTTTSPFMTTTITNLTTTNKKRMFV